MEELFTTEDGEGCWFTKKVKGSVKIPSLIGDSVPTEDETTYTESQDTQLPLGFEDLLECNQYVASRFHNGQESENLNTEEYFEEMTSKALFEEFFSLPIEEITERLRSLFYDDIVEATQDSESQDSDMTDQPVFMQRKTKRKLEAASGIITPSKKPKPAVALPRSERQTNAGSEDIAELSKRFKLCLSCKERGFPSAVYAQSRTRRKCSFCGLPLPPLKLQRQMLHKPSARPSDQADFQLLDSPVDDSETQAHEP